MFNKLRDPKIQGQLRHALSAVGAIFVTKGYLSGSDLEIYVGAGASVLALVLSWTATEKK